MCPSIAKRQCTTKERHTKCKTREFANLAAFAPPSAAGPRAETASTTTAALHRQLQLLRALLHYPRVRWLCNELDIMARIRSLLQLSIPSTSVLRLDVLSAHRPAVHEAIWFQLLALECARWCADSSPVAVLNCGKERIDADANWTSCRRSRRCCSIPRPSSRSPAVDCS